MLTRAGAIGMLNIFVSELVLGPKYVIGMPLEYFGTLPGRQPASTSLVWFLYMQQLAAAAV